MPRLTINSPKYRLHKASGRAVVTLAGRDFYLGHYGSPESKAEYNRLIAEWHFRGRMSHDSSASNTVTINEVIQAYLAHAEQYYVKNGKPTTSQDEVKRCLRPLHERYGSLMVCEFGPLLFKSLRQEIIERGTWCRRSVNKASSIVKRMFKWAAENEIVPAEIFHRLQTVNGLRRGRSAAPESQPVVPAPENQIAAVLNHVAAPIAAMIQVQRHTGMRPDEVTSMRLCEIDCSGKVWVYGPASHKTEHYGRKRRIFIGPKAQRVLMPFLRTTPEAYLFSPQDADAEHREKKRLRRSTPLSCGNRSGTNRKSSPKRTPGIRYTTNTYRGAISKACARAFPPPDHLARQKVVGKKGKRWESSAEWKKRLGERRWQELKAWQKAHHWSPNQLRHNAATELRKQFGIEAARVVLGHTSAVVTEIYAEMDFAKAEQIMAQAG